VFQKPDPDPGYDMPSTLFTVRVHDVDDMYLDTRERAFADYESARDEFEREVAYEAVSVAMKAMRRRAA